MHGSTTGCGRSSPAQSASWAGQARPGGQLRMSSSSRAAYGRDRARCPSPPARRHRGRGCRRTAGLGRGGGGDRLVLGVAGRIAPGPGRRWPVLGRFDLRHHLPGLLAHGLLQGRELGGLLGVPPARRPLGLGAGALLPGGPFQSAAGVGYTAALPRLLPAAAGEVPGRVLEAPGGGLHRVGLVRLDGVLDGGAAQRPLGDGAGGHRLVVAGLGGVGGRPGGAQLRRGLRVRAQCGVIAVVRGSAARPARTRSASRPAPRRSGRPRPAARSSSAIRASQLGDPGGAAAGAGGGADVLGVLLVVRTGGDPVRVAAVSADRGGRGEQVAIQGDGASTAPTRAAGTGVSSSGTSTPARLASPASPSPFTGMPGTR